MKRALICGVNGQDGAYLAKLLLSKGYDVFGTSRDAQMSQFQNLNRLHINDKVNKLSMAMNDFRSVLSVLTKVEPDEIYNLAGQSSVGLSFEQPVETMESISSGTLNLLEAIRFLPENIRLYNAGSSECFGNIKNQPACEDTQFRPNSPYAVAKCAAHWQVANYREAYNIFACTGILFNHESCLRPSRFVTKKIVETAKRISKGSKESLELGNIKIIRDWGWAPEYVVAMWLMMQRDKPEDFVIATGKSISLEQFIKMVFRKFDLEWQRHVKINSELFRPSDNIYSYANPEKANSKLGWKANFQIEHVIDAMIDEVL